MSRTLGLGSHISWSIRLYFTTSAGEVITAICNPLRVLAQSIAFFLPFRHGETEYCFLPPLWWYHWLNVSCIHVRCIWCIYTIMYLLHKIYMIMAETQYHIDFPQYLHDCDWLSCTFCTRYMHSFPIEAVVHRLYWGVLCSRSRDIIKMSIYLHCGDGSSLMSFIPTINHWTYYLWVVTIEWVQHFIRNVPRFVQSRMFQ